MPEDHCNLEKDDEKGKCLNHPKLHPETHKPEICVQCIKGENTSAVNENIWKPLEGKSYTCAYEGLNGRPVDCLNKYPENFRPNICYQCLTNTQIAQIAQNQLPSVYIELKQTNKNSVFCKIFKRNKTP